MEEYKKISSEMYEITKPVATSIGGDLEYYYELIKDTKGYILEAGVGTGRLLIPYIKKGLKVDGVDLSKDMLDICKANCQEHNVEAKLYLQNLKDLDIDNKYDAIIMPTGSFCLITDRDDMYNTLHSFKKHLNPNGQIILDLAFPIDFKKEIYTDILKVNKNTNIVFTSNNIGMDIVEQKTYSINRYEKWVDNKLVDSEIARFDMNWYGIFEFTYILDDVGFKDIKYEWGYGDENNKSLVTFSARI